MYYSELVLSFRKRPFLRWVLCGMLVLWGMRVLMQYMLISGSELVQHLPLRLVCLSGMPFPPWGKDTTAVLLFSRETPFEFQGKTWRARARCIDDQFRGTVLLYSRKKPNLNAAVFCAQVRLSTHGRKDLYMQGVMARAFVIGDIQVLQIKRAELAEWRPKIINYWKSLFARWQLSPEQQAICLAILLGDKTQLDAEVKSDFKAAGAMHILAVSGMHVGVLYALFSKLLFVSEAYRRKLWVRKGILTLLLFAYAWLCGFSHAIVRAVCMFGLALWGNSIQRRADPLNILCFVALVQLVWNPAAFFQVGFQLSYVAVASILLFEAPIHRLILPLSRRKVISAWLSVPASTVSVCVAANLGTLPLVALYFGSIPVYFLLTGILTSLPSTLLLSGLVLAVPITEILPDIYVGEGIQFLVRAFELPVRWVASLPFAQWAVPDFGVWKSLALFLCMTGMLLFTSKEQKARAVMCVLFAAILFVLPE